MTVSLPIDERNYMTPVESTKLRTSQGHVAPGMHFLGHQGEVQDMSAVFWWQTTALDGLALLP